MNKLHSYIFYILIVLIAGGCSTDYSDSIDQQRYSGDTIASIEPIAADVLRFRNGSITTTNIPNTGAYVMAFAAPVNKEESSGSPFTVFAGTVSTFTPSTSSAFLNETPGTLKMSEDFNTRLFPPSERLRLIYESTANGGAQELSRAMTGAQRNVFAVGDVWSSVKVTNWYNNSDVYINAKCISVSESAFFMQDVNSPELPPALLQQYIEKFDNSYKIIRDNFATESDVDGNGKVIVLFYNMNNARMLGYFSPSDKIASANSNFADMFYINMAAASNPQEAGLVNFTLAHEFQHMIFYDNKRVSVEAYNASTWLDEGLSMLAGYIAGFYNDGSDIYIKNFISKYYTLSLTNWTNANYGYSMLFTVYLYERFGGDAIKRIYKTYSAGWRSVEEVTREDFNMLFSDFVVALALSGRGYTNDPKYNFTGIDFNKYLPDAKVNLKPAATGVQAGATYGVKVYAYGLTLREVSGRTLSLFLNGAPAGFAIIKK